MATLVFDLDGVVYLGDQAIEGAQSALEACENLGHRILFATNSSLRSPAAAAAKIDRVIGYRATREQVVTSALAAAWLAGEMGGSAAFVVGADGVREALEARDIQIVDDPMVADIVVVGLDLDLRYESVRDATLAIRNGARFIATNLDPSYPMPNGQWPGAGAIVDLVKAASATVPIAAGKPEAAMIDLINDLVGSDEQVLMIGDRPSTDLAMAKAAGWKSVLVLSGVTADPDEVPAQWKPDLVVPSIADLPDELERLLGEPADQPSPQYQGHE